MRTRSDSLKLSRETVRELSSPALAAVEGAQASLSRCCTGTETATNICCIQSYQIDQCIVLTGTETANSFCVC